jgi:hypothetical protein
VRGEFVLPPPDEGEQRLLRATQLALGSSELRPSGDPSPVLLQLAAHRQVRLDVHGADGGAPAVFNLRGDGRVEELFVPVHDGVITLADLPPGPYRLSLVSPDAWLRPLDLVMPDAGTVEQRLELLPLATVSGTVLEKGRPVAKVPVGSESARQPTQTDLQGRFLLEGLPHGAVKIFVGLKGQSMTVDAPARVEFELTTGSLRQGALDGG